MNDATVDDALFSIIAQLAQSALDGWAPAVAVMALLAIVMLVMLVLGCIDAFARRDVEERGAHAVYVETRTTK
jgi:hypothetical protein